MAGKTEVFRVVFNDGENHNALVFQEPVQSKAYHADEMWVLPGATAAPVNDEGDIPHREPSGDPGENLGITWHFAK
jgi:hypothetical protein